MRIIRGDYGDTIEIIVAMVVGGSSDRNRIWTETLVEGLMWKRGRANNGQQGTGNIAERWRLWSQNGWTSTLAIVFLSGAIYPG